MNVIQTRYPNWRELRIHESSPGNRGTSVKLAKECKYYTASQYDPDLGFGNTDPSRGYRSENLEKQTFPDEAFDIVVSQDVLEHIFDAEAAFKDIHRTLKPGGVRSTLNGVQSFAQTAPSITFTLRNIMAIPCQAKVRW